MRITKKRTPIPPPLSTHIKLRARIERGDQGEPPVFLVQIHDSEKDVWHSVRIVDGERIDFTIYFP